MFCSSSLIIGPLTLSAIYSHNKEAIYYFSSIWGLLGLCIMGYVSTWPNAKIIGKQSLYNDSSKSIELPELNSEKKTEEDVTLPNETEKTPEIEVVSEGQPTTVDPVSINMNNAGVSNITR